MKFTLTWLKDWLQTDADLNTILDALNRIGLEVEGVENPAEKLGSFTIAHVLEAEPHPDADKLQVCKVSDGRETYTIVCGAPNARAGMKAVMGYPGDYVPGLDVTLAVRKVRGVESAGMMCSAKELELGDEHDGILDLPSDAPVGTKYVDYAGIDDPVIEIAITPNRQDCLGVYGIARDLAAAGLGGLKPYEVPSVRAAFDSPVQPSITTEDCSLFLARGFRGVKNGESPEWLQQRLKAVGQKPISALVDITNYFSLTFARPLHVYDAAKLTGGLTARKAQEGESFTALDDADYSCLGHETVIADASSVHGFGGVIGGLASGVADTTTDVVLECALFDPIATAMTGRTHTLNTDARYRFERGVDPLFAADAMEMASAMLLELCGGEAGTVLQAGEDAKFVRSISFRPERVGTLGGLEIEASRAVGILKTLGFAVDQSDTHYMVRVPSWRVDVEGEADLVEEVLRIYGLDHIPSVPLPPIDHKPGDTLSVGQRRARAARRTLAARGLNEAVTWSFMPRAAAKLFGGGDETLVVDNPISSELDCMRSSILPNLALAAQRNKDRGTTTFAGFEVGPQYESDAPEGQRLVAAGVRAFETAPKTWRSGGEAVTVFDAKADAEAVLRAAGAPVENLQVFDAPGYFHPGRSGTLRLGPKTVLATFGELHPRALKGLDVDGPIVGFEVYLDAIPAARKKGTAKPALALSNLQSVTRDFAFIVEKSKRNSDLLRAIRGADKAAITDVRVFDLYEGPGVEEGFVSTAITVTLTPIDKTFTDSEIDAIAAKIVAAAEKSVGGKLRG